MKLFGCQGIFFVNLISKLDVKMNYRIISKNHAHKIDEVVLMVLGK